jgi:hypothetical protein
MAVESHITPEPRDLGKGKLLANIIGQHEHYFEEKFWCKELDASHCGWDQDCRSLLTQTTLISTTKSQRISMVVVCLFLANSSRCGSLVITRLLFASPEG